MHSLWQQFQQGRNSRFDKLSVVRQECWHTLRPRSRLSVSRGLNVGVDDRENATQRANAMSGHQDLRRHHSGLLLIFLMPMFSFLFEIIRCTSAGPAIFRQRRIGLLGREFVIYKFTPCTRMRRANLKRILNSWNGVVPPSGSEVIRESRGLDSLRRFSLDELPQLINVLSGDMISSPPATLVKRRHDTRPGTSEDCCVGPV